MVNKQMNAVTRIGIDEVKQHRSNMVFVDARSATSISRNPVQVPGAIHVPVKELDERVKKLPRKGHTVVT